MNFKAGLLSVVKDTSHAGSLFGANSITTISVSLDMSFHFVGLTVRHFELGVKPIQGVQPHYP